LNVVPLRIPPLRDRREDILPLAEHFLRKHEPKSQRGLYQLSPELAAQLVEQEWPGNARELENFVRRVLALATGTVLGPHTMEMAEGCASEQEETAFKSGVTLQDMERQLLEKTLEATGGNRTRAAELMGVSLRTVRNKIRAYGLPARRPA
jgi:DNA-binding NtrC family response regulator